MNWLRNKLYAAYVWLFGVVISPSAGEPCCKTCGKLLTVPPLPIENPKWEPCRECGKV